MFILMAGVANATIIYDFEAKTSIFGPTGSFTLSVPTFITSDTYLFYSQFLSSSVSTGNFAGANFYINYQGSNPADKDVVGFKYDNGQSPYYFEKGTFTTLGEHFSVVLGPEQYGRLTVTDDGSTNPVPEPSTILLLGAGLVGLAAYGWKRRKE